MEVKTISEFICDNSKVLNKLADRYVEILLEQAPQGSNLASVTSARNVKSSLMKCYTEEKASNNGKMLNDKINAESSKCARMSQQTERLIVNTFGQDGASRLCEFSNSEASSVSKGKNLTLKRVVNAVCNVVKRFTTENNLRSKVQNETQKSESISVPKGYVECINPLYNPEIERLSESDYYSYQEKNYKTVKATLLTVVVFVLTMILTNVIRIYFGGTPGGDFSSAAEKGIFSFFSCLIIAPIIEEPAKMISIKGGFGKHFFFMFNLLEFGGYILMFLALGTPGLGVLILFRALAVIMHGLTTRIQMSGGINQGIFRTTIKLGICILLHFAFNALFLKSSVLGLPANKVCLFAIGFLGVAFGIFKMVQKGVSAMTGRFTTRGNLDYEYQ